MNRYWILTAWLWIAFARHGVAQAPEEAAKENAEVGQLVGQLTDQRGRSTFGGHATVFLCDAATGVPINRETKRPVEPTRHDPQIDKLWVVETDERGYFEFADVPVGRYRIVAQSWSGTEGFPGFDSDFHPSAFLVLHGVVDDIEIAAGQSVHVFPRQLSNHTLRIVNDPEEDHALLLISLKPTLGDGILGPYGWGKEFCRRLIGVTQMEVPHVTIMGLPENEAIHVGLMNYDNNPGVGAGSYEPGQREGKLRIVASWSNGHKNPPAELAPLTDHLEKNDIKIGSFLTDADPKVLDDPDEAARALFAILAADNDRMVTIEGMGRQRLADVLAAYSYLRLRSARR